MVLFVFFYSVAQLALEKYEDALATLQKADSLNSMNTFFFKKKIEVCKVHGMPFFVALLLLPTDL